MELGNVRLKVADEGTWRNWAILPMADILKIGRFILRRPQYHGGSMLNGSAMVVVCCK